LTIKINFHYKSFCAKFNDIYYLQDMNRFKKIGFLIIAISLIGISCNRGSGCAATEFAKKSVNVNKEKQASFKENKKKSASKSSVMPAEVKAKKR